MVSEGEEIEDGDDARPSLEERQSTHVVGMNPVVHV